MPHTSRRKKKVPIKRVEITDEDGWTRVTTTDTARRAPKAALLPEASARHMLWPVSLAEEGASVEKIQREFEKPETQWLSSNSCKVLKTTLEKHVLSDDVQLDACFIFGSGSFCGVRAGFVLRHGVAMTQVAVLRSIKDTIRSITGKDLPLYAQDPAYNPIDKDFLRTLDITVVDSPAAFDLLTEKSLAYTPMAEMNVELHVMKKKPAVLLTSKLTWFWRNSNGLPVTSRIALDTDTSDKPVRMHELEESDHQHDQEVAEAHRAEAGETLEHECQIFESFLERRQEASLPDLDVKDNPFHNQRLYWLKSVNGEVDVGNLDFDARVPIPISVFPSTYRSDATSVQTTTETKVEGEVNQGAATQHVGREDTRFRKEETVNVSSYDHRKAATEKPDDFQVLEESHTRVSERYPSQFQERQYTDRQANRFAEVDLSRERYQAPSQYRPSSQVNVDVTTTRRQGNYDYQRADNLVRDQPIVENQIDITEREYRRRTQPNYDIEYERRRPAPRDDIVIERDTVREVKVEKEPKGKMGYYDDHGEYHSFRRGVERAAEKVFHPFSRHDHHESVVDAPTARVREGVVESVRYVEPRGGVPGNTVTIPCHFIRIGDLLILQGRPCQVIRISQSGQTGQYRYLGVDLFTRQLHEESSFCSNPEPSIVIQSMLGPVFKQYRILDIREDGQFVCMTETGDVKQGMPVVDQGGLFNKISRAFDDGRGSVRALVINDGGRELIVDYKVIHGSRL